MPEQVTGTIADTTPAEDATEQVADSKGLTEADVADTWRKRQAGADAARVVAEAKAAALEVENAKYRAADLERQQVGLSETAVLQARVEAAEKKAAEAEKAAEAKVLNKLYPTARAEFPEVTDEARLAKLEAMLSDSGPAPETDTPRAMRAPKSASQGAQQNTKSVKDLEAELAAMPNPFSSFGIFRPGKS
jgi:hypothetical protein